jgi:hypothetical protein
MIGKSGRAGLWSGKSRSSGVITLGTASAALRRDASQPSPAEREAGPGLSFIRAGDKVAGSWKDRPFLDALA